MGLTSLTIHSQERRYALRAPNYHSQFCTDHARVPPPACPLLVPHDLRRCGQSWAVRPERTWHRVLAGHSGRPRHGRATPRRRQCGARQPRSPERCAHARRAALCSRRLPLRLRDSPQECAGDHFRRLVSAEESRWTALSCVGKWMEEWRGPRARCECVLGARRRPRRGALARWV